MRLRSLCTQHHKLFVWVHPDKYPKYYNVGAYNGHDIILNDLCRMCFIKQFW